MSELTDAIAALEADVATNAEGVAKLILRP
jgi:hypothetical protein